MRNDEQRLIEILFIEDCKLLKNVSLLEYYSNANTTLQELLNPDLSYPYEKMDMDKGQKMYKVKHKNDPTFVITLKRGGLNGNYYWIVDFYFPESEKGYARGLGLTGENYMDTVCKVLRDEILPYVEKSEYGTLFFKPYINDNAGEIRKKVFRRIIDKFLPKDKFDFTEKDSNFIIKRK
jgi:hypothetical protein